MRDWLLTATVLLGLFSFACSHSSRTPTDAGTPPPEQTDGGTTPPGASVQVPVSVPEGLRDAPFDSARTLTVPPGFSVSVFARVPEARFLAGGAQWGRARCRSRTRAR